MSADTRSVLAAVGGFCASLGLALFPLFALLVFVCFGCLVCFAALLGRSVFAVAWPFCVRDCSVARLS